MHTGLTTGLEDLVGTQLDNLEYAKVDLWVLSAQAGDMRAFSRLYQKFNQPLLRFAYRFSGDEQLARDAVQEAWITLSKTLGKLEDARGFKVWAYKTVRWRVTDQIRKRGAVHENIDDLYAQPNVTVTDVDATSDQLRFHLNQLADEDKQTLSLFYLGELKIIEIAAVLEIPVGTVKSRLNRARAQLRQQMTGEEK